MTVPPLRERAEDIQELVEHFVQKFAMRQGKVIDTIPEDVMAALEGHDWPGNIRELQNVVERGVILTTTPVLSRRTTEHLTRRLPAPASGATIGDPGTIRTLADAERAHITAMLHETNWVVGGRNGAAAQLGLPRTTLLARMQRLGIPVGNPRNRSSHSPSGVVRVMGDLSSRLKDEAPADLRVMEAVAS